MSDKKQPSQAWNPTDKECPVCHARPTYPCTDKQGYVISTHRSRG